ncbi:heavy metal translocating P-type ATPase [Pseudoroseomonas rhizosphaerae]|uniref:P-type Zn(2+) transporter n=1 Tax=Teichococcus rhizosphaerae TaxID=1335062 RepID=A0A2C7AB70_9PROT|nr:heavy metal translocating P-type ATPase [Pseudoroseomonas rhizosphaerae]PHK94655.1 heavy metal translocating P-type ATPase [Pseudoroseomonas rhizosphaerae]
MTDKFELDIPVLLPEVPDAADACVGRLVSTLSAKPGVERAHVLAADGDTPAKLCIHFDGEALPLSRVRDMVRAAGAEISGRYGHATWQVEGIGHERRARTVGETLCQMPGVLQADASASGSVRVEYDKELVDEAAIVAALGKLKVKPGKRTGSNQAGGHAGHDHGAGDHAGHDHGPGGHAEGAEKHGLGDGHDHAHANFLGPNTELIFALACGALLAIGFAIEKLVAGAPDWLPTAFYVGAYVFGGFFTLREAIDNLKLKKFEIDTLMLVAAAGAAALGAFAEGALLLFLFSLGHALEHYAMGRAKRAIEALAELAPDKATVRRGGQTSEIPVEELVVGDVVIVRPNERLPADGFLIKGSSAINQAPVTGESIPVDKEPVADVETARAKPDAVDAASRIFAGTINGGGAIEIEVTRRSNESALAKVVKMVSEAETQKSPTQRFTDRFERIFVPVVLALSFILLFAWVVVDEPFRDSFYRAMAVLVAASPCALAIATPSAVLSGVARAARGGVLVKGGAPLENLGSLKAIAFDKTGTLTEGRPRITDVVPVDGASEADLLTLAVAVEALSDHPLAQAIVKDGRERLGGRELPVAIDVKSLTGRGVTATVDGETVWIGKAEMFGVEGIPSLNAAATDAIAQLREGGRTTMVVRKGDRDIGAIGLMDTPREAAKVALRRLRDMGITRMIMISGDNQKVADAIAREVGLDEAWGDLMPEDKVAAIKKLAGEDKVAMVGDGVNDAPAMASATVGIAMGAAGSDVALETADVALMADDLAHLPFAVGLSRHTRGIIRQNVFVSLGVVAFLVPATILGLGIGPAVAMHEGSTLLVVFNALRLLAFKDRTGAA